MCLQGAYSARGKELVRVVLLYKEGGGMNGRVDWSAMEGKAWRWC